MFLELDSGIPRAEDLQQVTVIEDKTEIPKTAPDIQKIQKSYVLTLFFLSFYPLD